MLVLKNNIELDVKTKCIEEGKTQAWVAEEVGTSPAYVSRIVNSREQIVNKTFLAMMDALGYDVRLTYERRETTE
jgi:plasmid maintenance system antidote protein VapI